MLPVAGTSSWSGGCGARAATGAPRHARGRLRILQWLRAHGCPWDDGTCNVAVLNGQLETLRWAHENGCEWSAQTCFYAAYGGHLEILQWLRAKGCPWVAATCTA